MTLTQFCQWDIIIKFLLTFLLPLILTGLATYYAVRKRQAPLAILTCAGCFSFVNLSALVNLSYLGNPAGYLTYLNKFVSLDLTTKGKVAISDFVYQSNEKSFELIKIFDVQDLAAKFKVNPGMKIAKSMQEPVKAFVDAKIKNPLTDIMVDFGQCLTEIMSGCIFNLFVILVFAIFMYLIKAND